MDILHVTVPFDSFHKLSNDLNANKVIVQFSTNINDYVNPDDYDAAINQPIAVISEHPDKISAIDRNLGLTMNQFGMYEIIGNNNIKNTHIQNLLPDSYPLYLRIVYYK